MLSNLLIKANLLAYKDHDQEPRKIPSFDMDLGSINAFELRSIHDRFDIGISFNPSWYRKVTKLQQEQWTERLFFKDKNLSMSKDGRSNWVHDLAQKLLPQLDTLLPSLDVEDALELLWLADKVASSAARVKLLDFLKHHYFSEQDAMDRIRSYTL